MKQIFRIVAVAGLNVGAIVLAQNIDPQPPPPPPTYASLIAMPVPVTSGDINDQPYRVVGEVVAEVRKATIFNRSPSESHVFRELWERAQRLGADAVVNARYSEARVTALSWGSRRATGQAVRFLTDAEIAARAGR
jgi:uncharacterized protein YbjQ (UPF0145 family)